MTSILLTVTGAKARATVSGPLTSGMVGIPVTIEYDDEWNGLTKNLVCRCGQWGPDRGETRTIRCIGDTATVAHEVMKADMHLYLGIEGYSTDEKLVMSTTWADCGKIQYGANAWEEPSTKPKLPFWPQLQTEIKQIREYTVTEAQIAAVVAAYLDKNPIESLIPSQNITDISSVKTVLRNIMTILKAQVEDEDGTLQGYNMDVSVLVAQNDNLIAALGSTNDSVDSGDNGGETEKTLTSISATYSGGSVPVGTAVTALTGIVVTAHYSDGSTATVTGYTLSGTITEGNNTITVIYQGKTTTFTVTGIAESGGSSEVTTLSLCTNDGYLEKDGVTVKALANAFHSDSIDVSTIKSVKTKYRNAFIDFNYSPFLFYDADGAFLSGATGAATEADNAAYNYYEITESDIPDGAKYLKIVFIYQQGALNLNIPMTVYK